MEVGLRSTTGETTVYLIRGCKKFCVNGYLAGNCRIARSDLSDYKKPEDLIGENGLLKQLTKALVERALQADMAEHLGHARSEPVANPG